MGISKQEEAEISPVTLDFTNSTSPAKFEHEAILYTSVQYIYAIKENVCSYKDVLFIGEFFANNACS